MPVYTVHAPVANNVDLSTTDKFSFVRDGFHFWAFVFGVFWLAWHRLWLALIGWIVLMVAVDVGLPALGVGRGAVLTINLLLALLLGFEAASLKRWTLSRRKWRQLDIVVADDEESAERRFFDRWTNADGDTHQPSSWHVPTSPNQPRAMPATQGIIGLFPEPGGSR